MHPRTAQSQVQKQEGKTNLFQNRKQVKIRNHLLYKGQVCKLLLVMRFRSHLPTVHYPHAGQCTLSDP